MAYTNYEEIKNLISDILQHLSKAEAEERVSNLSNAGVINPESFGSLGGDGSSNEKVKDLIVNLVKLLSEFNDSLTKKMVSVERKERLHLFLKVYMESDVLQEALDGVADPTSYKFLVGHVIKMQERLDSLSDELSRCNDIEQVKRKLGEIIRLLSKLVVISVAI